MKKFLLFLLVVMFFAGCSGNLLKSIDSGSGGTAQKVADAQNELDQGNYAAAIASVQSEVATYNASTGTLATVTNTQAEVVYGQALLGQAGVDAPTIFENALSKIDGCSGSTQCNFNIIKDLVPNADNATLTEATARLNNSVTTSADSSASGVQLTTAVANGINAAVTILDKFDSDGNGVLDSTYTTDTSVNTAWGQIESDVTANASSSVEYVEAMVKSSSSSSDTSTCTLSDGTTKPCSSANQDLLKALSDAQTKIDDYSGQSSVTIADVKILLGLN